jgi:hypothetical protein
MYRIRLSRFMASCCVAELDLVLMCLYDACVWQVDATVQSDVGPQQVRRDTTTKAGRRPGPI